MNSKYCPAPMISTEHHSLIIIIIIIIRASTPLFCDGVSKLKILTNNHSDRHFIIGFLTFGIFTTVGIHNYNSRPNNNDSICF